MPFLGPLVAEQIDEKWWKLANPLGYQGREDTIVVPEDFETDFASVPRPFWWFVPRYGRHTKAAVLHDYLCQKGDTLDPPIHRSDADGIFRRTLRESGVDVLRRWIMWAAVRWVKLGLFEVSEGGVGEMFGVITITLLALPVVLPGAAVVLASLLSFWVLRLVFFLGANIVGEHRGEEPIPRVTWSA